MGKRNEKTLYLMTSSSTAEKNSERLKSSNRVICAFINASPLLGLANRSFTHMGGGSFFINNCSSLFKFCALLFTFLRVFFVLPFQISLPIFFYGKIEILLCVIL